MNELPINQIVLGDNCEVMRQMPSESIDLVVTSPPYDDLRTYGGHSWDFESVAQQLWRLIKPGGVVVWVVNDATVNGSETGTSFRQALRFMEIGFRLHDTMIYSRDGCGFPETNRYYPVEQSEAIGIDLTMDHLFVRQWLQSLEPTEQVEVVFKDPSRPSLWMSGSCKYVVMPMERK